jgi:two-component system, OmpR family, phosphate regulon response regulator PhoB
MKRYKILAIEDEQTTQALLLTSLGTSHEITIAGNLERSRNILEDLKPDLILLDINLPDGNGYDFFNEINNKYRTPKIPVVFLTLESDVQAKIQAFAAGAYDYITKPFSREELLARVDAHCARSSEILSAQYVPTELGSLIFNQEARVVYKKLQNGQTENINLSPTEFKLFEYLVTHAGKTISREKIAKNVWNKTHFQSRTIDRHISSLRKKILDTGVQLTTVSHEGYLLHADEENI